MVEIAMVSRKRKYLFIGRKGSVNKVGNE